MNDLRKDFERCAQLANTSGADRDFWLRRADRYLDAALAQRERERAEFTHK